MENDLRVTANIRQNSLKVAKAELTRQKEKEAKKEREIEKARVIALAKARAKKAADDVAILEAFGVTMDHATGRK